MTTNHPTCRRCNRALTSPASVARQMGATCARNNRREAAVEDVKAATLAKALEDVQDGAVVDTRRTTQAGRRVYAVLSSTGDAVYLATASACTCRAGHAGRTCRHSVAARLVAA